MDDDPGGQCRFDRSGSAPAQGITKISWSSLSPLGP